MGLARVVSGGQTGVDRAGLDAALELGMPIGGYCPCGRKAEDGTVPARYPLIELSSDYYCTRTEKNVVESDGTLILNQGELTEGTKLTHDYARQHGRPCLIVQLDQDPVLDPARVAEWLRGNRISVLNVAGPRESKCPGGIYDAAFRYLRRLFQLECDRASDSGGNPGDPGAP
ncbi:putative molybdenum carrier protein [Geomesophilobacter sediminis]|uniref:Putative molybdenum carrier protein n=1 Tax=Geomesophilobacter sediminis TaxID=2798584 RepID=A0A8J7IP61_9BACT|nr:putative molybdenum carrier protein [Geomesophilobacter sediminis]MBJ6724039.1 putative molybdenum carrier protein [Geomesophilobacter sediminis]